MQYAMLIHEEPDYVEALAEDEQKAVFAEYIALAEDPRARGGAQLQPIETATTVRVQDGQTLTTDGPFADTKEVFGGYYVFEADEPRRGDRAGGADPGGPSRRRDRGPSVGGALALLEEVFRDEWGRVLASLVGFLGDFDLAEEAAQEAFAVAAERWPRDGVPANPGAWLTVTARNRAIDRIRRERTLAEKTRQLEVPEVTMDELDDTVIEDERLELIFTCCHPGARTRGAGRAHAARARWADDGGDRARVPGLRGDDEAAPVACEGEDQGDRDSVRRPGRASAARPPGRGAGGGLSDLQRGLLRAASTWPARRSGWAACSPR